MSAAWSERTPMRSAAPTAFAFTASHSAGIIESGYLTRSGTCCPALSLTHWPSPLTLMEYDLAAGIRLISSGTRRLAGLGRTADRSAAGPDVASRRLCKI